VARGEWLVVTGAASGIGAATASRLRQDGWQVLGVDLHEAAGCDATAVCDLRVPAQVEAAAAHQALGDGVAGVVNVAGISIRRGFSDLDEETWAAILDTNLGGAYRMTRALWPRMIGAGRGTVVSVASTTAFRAEPGIAAYAASKAGVVGLTRCLALEGGPHGIRANAVAPGVVRTPLTMSRPWSEAEWAERVARVPMGRVAEPEDIADVIAFLVSDQARHVSGEVVVVNGGASVR
jgi:NAD(P)-dependent dehydrogenase (short-subunit alcohol dehydrogenase family)